MQLTPENNRALAFIFQQMAECYRYLGNQERFRAAAYAKVSGVLRNMKEDVATYAADVKTLDEIGGIGESIAEKIIEYLHTGKIATFEKLKKTVPYDLLGLMDITGFGPATLKTLHEKLHIDTREDLIDALSNDQLKGVKGFAEKRIISMKKALKLYKENKRMPLKEAEKIGNEILNAVNKIPGVQKAILAGSLRRKKETIGDIDILILALYNKGKKIVNQFIKLPQVETVLAKGSVKASVLLKQNKMQVDIRIVQEHEYGAAMLYFTGTKEHNIRLRTIAKRKGWKINEYGVFDNSTGKRIAGETEESIYKLFGLDYIPPEKRLGKNELDAVDIT